MNVKATSKRYLSNILFLLRSQIRRIFLLFLISHKIASLENGLGNGNRLQIHSSRLIMKIWIPEIVD